MNGAEAAVKCLEAEGVEIVYGYPGVAICPFFDSIFDTKIRTILVRGRSRTQPMRRADMPASAEKSALLQ